MIISEGVMKLSVGDVFPAIIIGSLDDPEDDPPATYVFPRWWLFRPSDPTGVNMPAGMWKMDFEECKIKLEIERGGAFAARNLAELRRRDGNLRYLPFVDKFPVSMMVLRPPELYDVNEFCSPIILPNAEEAPPPLFAFDVFVDPESTYCDCEETEPCPPDETPIEQ